MKIVARSKFTLRARYSFYASLLLAAGTMTARPAFGDEGGVSFWLPGFVGSLAATPQVPGFSFAMLYYHSSVSAGGNVAFARQVSHGNITANFTGNLNANINGSADLSMAILATPSPRRYWEGKPRLSWACRLEAAKLQSIQR